MVNGKPRQKPRNYILAGGISRYGRSAMYRKKALYKKKIAVKNFQKTKEPHFVVKDVNGAKNGGKRIVLTKKSPRYYPTEDDRRPLRTRKKPGVCKLRSSITPGTVLILLVGRHKGKRVVFLKQLESGLLLVTGPFYVNGVPLRRVNQAFVIATQTKVDLSALQLPEYLDDGYFRRTKVDKKKKGDGNIFADSSSSYEVSDRRKGDQALVDEQVKQRIDKMMAGYLRAKFTLQKGQYPHKMVF